MYTVYIMVTMDTVAMDIVVMDTVSMDIVILYNCYMYMFIQCKFIDIL